MMRCCALHYRDVSCYVNVTVWLGAVLLVYCDIGCYATMSQYVEAWYFLITAMMVAMQTSHCF